MKNIYIAILFVALAAASWYAFEEFSIRNYIPLILVLFSAQILLNDVLEIHIVSRLKSKYFNLVIGPGTVVHELSHALAAKITGCSITRISFFNPGQGGGILGYVEYVQPADRFQPLRSIIIGFAPFFGCGLFLAAILNYLALQHPGMDLVKPDIVEIGDVDAVISTMNVILTRFYDQLLYLDLSDPCILLLLYLEFSFALGSAPSTKDISDAFSSLLRHKLEALALLLFLISGILLIEYGPQLMEHGDFIPGLAVVALKWMILVLMISSSMLLVAIPLSYMIVETAQIRGAFKIIPPALFVLVYFLMTKYAVNYAEVSVEMALLSSTVVFLVSLLILRNPQLFIKTDQRY